MTIRFLLTLFTLAVITSCGQDYNSNYNDRGTYADIGIPPGTPLYAPYVIFQNKCFSCHGSEWKNYTTSQQWIDAGLVTRGNFATSPLKTNLKNYGGTMPPDPYSPLTASEIDTVKTWINSL